MQRKTVSTNYGEVTAIDWETENFHSSIVLSDFEFESRTFMLRIRLHVFSSHALHGMYTIEWLRRQRRCTHTRPFLLTRPRHTHAYSQSTPNTRTQRWMEYGCGVESMLAPCCSKAEYGFSENVCTSSQRTQPKSYFVFIERKNERCRYMYDVRITHSPPLFNPIFHSCIAVAAAIAHTVFRMWISYTSFKRHAAHIVIDIDEHIHNLLARNSMTLATCA